MKSNLIFLAIGILTTTLPAHAATVVAAELGPIAISLTDLSPGANGSPYLRPSTNAFNYSEVSSFAQTASDPVDAQESSNYDTWSTSSTSASTFASNASASIAGTNSDVGVGAKLSASGTTMDFMWFSNEYLTAFSARASSPYLYENGHAAFLLGPSSMVTFSAQGLITINMTKPSHIQGYGDTASAHAGLEVYGQQLGGTSDSLDLYSNGSTGRIVQVSYRNELNTEILLEFRALASAEGITYASAVPEPDSYSYFAVGLFGLFAIIKTSRSFGNGVRAA